MTARTTDILTALEDYQANHVKQLQQQESKIDQLKKEVAADRDRLEELESHGKSPGKTLEGRSRLEKAWRTYETRGGQVVELPSTVKMVEALPPKDQPELRFDRVLAAMMVGERCEDKTALQYLREKKQLVTTTTGMNIPEEYQSEWIDLIRAAMVTMTAGASTVVMDAKTLNASAVASDPAANWHTEAGSINANNPTFEARSLTAQTLVVRCQASVECAQDSPDFGAQLAGVMAKAMAVELDRVGLVGSGTPPEPQGILGTNGIKQVTGVSTISSYAKLLEGVRKLLESNLALDVATKYAIMSPSSWAAYEALETGITNDLTQLPRPRALEAMQFLVTTNGLDVGSPATSTIFLGDFRDLVYGIRKEASVESLRLSSYGSNLLLEFVGYLRADVMLKRPASFCTLEDVSVR